MRFDLCFIDDKWSNSGTIFLKGNVSFEEQCTNVASLCRLVEDLLPMHINHWVRFASNLSGQFSLVVQYGKRAIIITSPGLFNPVYYQINELTIMLSDRVSAFGKKEVDRLMRDAFLCSGNTPLNATLYKGIFFNPSGCITEIDDEGRVTTIPYFSYAVTEQELFSHSFDQLSKLAVRVLDNVFDRVVTQLNGRVAVVPLSGGYDSRLILSSLKQRGYQRLIAFTYGKPGNPEARIARLVTEKLGLEWHNIEYTGDFIDAIFDKPDLERYIGYAFNGKSSVCLHEYYAVKYLKKNKLIPDDAVFIPGHSGDLLGGSQLIKVIPIDLKSDEIAALFVKKKFTMHRLNLSVSIGFETLYRSYIDQWYKNGQLPYSVFEDIDIKERISKFILNASQVFPYFGYDVLTPFWEMDLLRFFSKVPPNFKKGKFLYDSVLENNFFKPLNLVFVNEMNPSLGDIYISKLKKFVKPYLPMSIRKRYTDKNDLTNYKKITAPLMADLESDKVVTWFSGNDYNEVICQWILANYIKLDETNENGL